MKTLRVHYRIFESPHCGHPKAKNFTTVPAKVTCRNCKRMLLEEVNDG